jgi:hypothetical protein
MLFVINQNTYSASFTAGSLLLEEISRVIEYILNDTLEEKKNELISNNTIKINSESARKRVLQEIRKRKKMVGSVVWERFAVSSQAERKILLFYVCLKTYTMLYDFQKEVVLESWKNMKRDLDERNVELFLEQKSHEHPEIDEWTDSTRDKVVQVIIRILKESGILIDSAITPLEATDEFWRLFGTLNDEWFLELALLNKVQREKILRK